MKRFFALILSSLVLISATDVAAQGRRYGFGNGHNPAADGLGITFGYVHSAYRITDWATDEKETSDGLDGFNVGLTKDIRLVDDMLFLQTGLLYTYQNDSRNQTEGTIRIIGDWDEHFLSVPVKLKYEVPVMKDLSVFAMVGPTFVGGLSSSVKYRARIADGVNAAMSYNYFSGKVRVNDEMPESMADVLQSMFPETKYRRVDVQMGGAVGVRFMEIFEAQIGYDWGLVNKFKGETLDDLKMRRQQLYISVGIRF